MSTIEAEPSQLSSAYERGEASETAREIMRNNLLAVEERYGKNGTEQERIFHNEHHSQSVMNRLEDLIRVWNEDDHNEPISQREGESLLMAASGHDRKQGAGPGRNEMISGDEVTDDMEEAGYGEDERTFVRGAIVATIPTFEGGTVKQLLTETKKILSGRQLELAQLLADADLGHFGEAPEVYRDEGLKIFYELRANDGKSTRPEDITREEAVAWFTNEIKVLEGHQWLTSAAATAFPGKAANKEGLVALIAQLQEAPDIADLIRLSDNET
jgi:hypothetical protein